MNNRVVQNLDIFEVRLNMRMHGQKLLNVFHYRANNVSGDPTVSAVSSNLESTLTVVGPGGLIPFYKNASSLVLDFEYLDIQMIYPVRQAYERYMIDETGVKNDAPLPQNVQASIKKSTNEPGRTGIGRMEVAGLTINDCEDGLLLPAYKLEVLSIGQALAEKVLVEGSTGYELLPTLLHRTTPLTDTPWTNYTVQDTVRVARRRTVGVGK